MPDLRRCTGIDSPIDHGAANKENFHTPGPIGMDRHNEPGCFERTNRESEKGPSHGPVAPRQACVDRGRSARKTSRGFECFRDLGERIWGTENYDFGLKNVGYLFRALPCQPDLLGRTKAAVEVSFRGADP